VPNPNVVILEEMFEGEIVDQEDDFIQE